MDRRLKIAFIILLIILLSIISFVGLFVKDTKFVKNIIPEYQLGMDLAGYRAITVTPVQNTETKYYDKDGKEVEKEVEGGTSETVVTNQAELTLENFKKTKQIIEDRLSQLSVSEYLIRLDENTGSVSVQIPEDELTDLAGQFLYSKGEFTIEDEQGEILLDNSNLETVRVGYNTTPSGTSVYLSIKFNEDSIEKFREITTSYTPETETSTEDTNTVDTNTVATNTTAETIAEDSSEEEESLGKVSINIDGSPLLETSFSEEISNGELLLTLGTSSDSASINSYINQASNIAILLNNGPLPLDYTLDQNRFIKSDITMEDGIIPAIVLGSILVIALLVMIIKYKKLGLFAIISYIGYMAVLLLALRYTNIVITLEGICALIIVAILNYVLLYSTLHRLQKQDKTISDYKKAYNGVTITTIFVFLPMLIIGVTLSFANWLPAYSFGTVLFWGIFVMALYHVTITRAMFLNSINSKK